MRRVMVAAGAFLFISVWALGPRALWAQGSFELVTGKAFDQALPKDFYLEGNAIPTQKRNAALLKTPAGARLLLALLDTSGYSSQVQEKYLGMAIIEGPVSICGQALAVGSYGFGLKKTAGESNEPAEFFVYNQAGDKVAQCSANKDTQLEHPRPLEVFPKGASAQWYLGRYLMEIRP